MAEYLALIKVNGELPFTATSLERYLSPRKASAAWGKMTKKKDNGITEKESERWNNKASRHICVSAFITQINSWLIQLWWGQVRETSTLDLLAAVSEKTRWNSLHPSSRLCDACARSDCRLVTPDNAHELGPFLGLIRALFQINYT